MTQTESTLTWQPSHPTVQDRSSLITTLPGELRQMVLEELLLSDQPLRRVYLTNIKGKPNPRFRNHCGIIHTSTMASCKQFLWEAAMVFYHKNTFLLSDEFGSYFIWNKDAQDRYVPLMRSFVTPVLYDEIDCEPIELWILSMAGYVTEQLRDGSIKKWYAPQVASCLHVLKSWPNAQSMVVKVSSFAAAMMCDILRLCDDRERAKDVLGTAIAEMCVNDEMRLPSTLRIALETKDRCQWQLEHWSDLTMVVDDAVEKAKALQMTLD